MSTLHIIVVLIAIVVVDKAKTAVAPEDNAAAIDNREAVKAMIGELDKIRDHMEAKYEVEEQENRDKTDISDYSHPERNEEELETERKRKRPPLQDEIEDDKDEREVAQLRKKKNRKPVIRDDKNEDHTETESDDEDDHQRKKKKKSTVRSHHDDDDDDTDVSADERIEHLRKAARDVVMAKLRAIVDKAAAEAGDLD